MPTYARRAPWLAALALALAAAPAVAQTTYTWTALADNPRNWYINGLLPGTQPDGNWPNGTGLPPNAPPNSEPLSNVNNVLNFPSTLSYTAINNLDPTLGNFQLNQMNLFAQPTVEIRIAGNPLVFANSTLGATPSIAPSGNATFTIQNNLTLSGALTINGALGGILNLGDPTGVVPQVISGAGSLTVNSVGTVRIGGANTYTGNTVVSLGTVLLAGTGSIATSPVLSVASGATFDATGLTGGANFSGGQFALAAGQSLQGAGSVLAPPGGTLVRSGATVAPGTGIGTLNLTGNVTIAGLMQAEVAGSNADRLAVTGNLTLDPTSSLTFPAGNTYDGLTPLLLATYTGSLSGTFGQVNNPPAGYGLFYGTFPGQPNAVVLAVPEPGALALVGLAGALFVRRRRARLTSSPAST
jgi:autotransporter-associated beta strand protein